MAGKRKAKAKKAEFKGVNIDFSFSGYINGARITKVTENLKRAPYFRVISTEGMTPKKLAASLNSGKYTISLGDFLYENSEDQEIEITDFQESYEQSGDED